MAIRVSIATLMFAMSLSGPVHSAAAEVFELRRYQVPAEKLDSLDERFKQSADGLLRSAGMEPIGYWTAVDPETDGDNFIYLVRHQDVDAAKTAWDQLAKDPKWLAAKEAYPVGDLSRPVDQTFLELTDYSTDPSDSMTAEDDNAGNPPGLFELRIYQAAQGKLDKLDARFADHTIGLFKKHAIESVAYWHILDSPKSADHLVYIIRHKDAAAAKQSWSAFVADPDWKTAAANSGVGRLMQAPESIYMRPTDYSKIR